MEAFLKTGSLAKSSATASTSGEQVKPEKKKNSPTPWVEKYRPRTVDEVAYQEEVVAVLKKSLQRTDLPNLLFYGPPGTGKTSTILAASRQLFGDMFSSRVLELNSSDERGIKVIREKVKTFAQLTANSNRADGRPCPPFKIIILDEADSMTHSAQTALRRTMEKETKTTRFCLICNYVSRIIEPLASRCLKFRFRPLAEEAAIKRLQEIAVKEGVTIKDEALALLVDTSQGDLRKAISFLQSAHCYKGADGISSEDIYEMTGVIPKKWIDDLLAVCTTKSFEKVDKFVIDFMGEGYPASQLFSQLTDAVINSDYITDTGKAAICERIAVNDYRISSGADEYLQVMDVCTIIMQA